MLIYNAVAAVFCLVLIGFVFLAGHRRSISQSRARLPWSHSESR
jgi:hypothetical protein